MNRHSFSCVVVAVTATTTTLFLPVVLCCVGGCGCIDRIHIYLLVMMIGRHIHFIASAVQYMDYRSIITESIAPIPDPRPDSVRDK